jgi:7-cyano-7-deazaguanine tRNA-ribosyltransferase
MPEFHVNHIAQSGRLGRFTFVQEDLETFETPFLFPVTFLVTGTTARGGGVWKYVLQADKKHGLMRHNMPILAETLHFLDYDLSSSGLQKWRQKGIRTLYKEQADVDYRGPIFLDSGGFRLMWRDGLDLSRYGICLDSETEAESILKLQMDLGANIVASLDYPLPPGLALDEQKQRMERSLQNALHVGHLLRELENPPFLFMAVHGQIPSLMTEYVESLFEAIQSNGLDDLNFGIAIGSLVPMRGAGKVSEIIELVLAATKAIPEKFRQRVPVHTFGLSGLLIPYLVYCGVDTFDSSTYMQEARAYKYTDHETRQAHRVLDMPSSAFEKCDCRVCQGINLRELQDALVTKSNYKPLENGIYKSKYYADVALHNLIADTNVIEQTRLHIKENRLENYLVELAEKFPQMRPALATIAEYDSKVQQSGATVLTDYEKPKEKNKPTKHITLRHRPSDFDINSNGYTPPARRILLIIPCSSEKPYSESTSHRFLSKHIETAIPDWGAYIHKVSLSGLYGPVPKEWESETAVREYDFLLKHVNREQIALCTQRLVIYLKRHEGMYEYFVAYAATKAYRMVLENTAKQFEKLVILPNALTARKSSEFYRLSNVDGLIEFLSTSLSDE